PDALPTLSADYLRYKPFDPDSVLIPKFILEFTFFWFNLFSIMRWFDNIPKIWKRAYLMICLWYAFNFAISTFFEWKLKRPFSYVLWNGLYLWEALCILIIIIFLYSHWLFRFRPVVQLVGHSIGIVSFFMIMGTLSYFFTDYMDGLIYFDNWKEFMVELLNWEALRFYDQYIITVGVYYVISYFQGLQREEKEKTELNLKNKEMQISLLKSQINPHFLFNTLNSISTLMHSSKDQARKVITQLSDIFRYALDSHTGKMVKLAHEVDFIESYIRIQQVRFGERLKFQKHVDETCLGLSIPPMILQPLVENSVKYGIGPKEDGGTINLLVRRQPGGVYFEVNDNGLGVKAKKVMDGSIGGVGMKNTDMRLKTYYGPDAGLSIMATDEGYIVSFVIPVLESLEKSTGNVQHVENQTV
ncbi:MAG: histidine kinase, partial [Cyclobacteriaceae bacterium]|nr:histidine kinase [Cyclobacteriaceae bacterium]